MTDNLDRRLFLAAGSAGVVLGAFGAAVAAEQDPIFAAIERHRAARRRLDEVCALLDEALTNDNNRDATEYENSLLDAASSAEFQALDALAETVPMTIAGFVAALKHMQPYSFDEDCCLTRFVEIVVNSPLLAI